jgi:hypothetical protein
MEVGPCAGWRVRRWTDADKDSAPMQLALDLARRYELGPRGLADLLRLAAVSLEGGVYMDSDTVPLLPLDGYVGDRAGWVGTSEDTRGGRTLHTSSFGFPKGDPFLSLVWARAEQALRRGVRSDHHVAGPHAWRSARNVAGGSIPEVDYSFANTLAGDLQRAMARAQEFDADELRERFPGVPVLHVTFYTAREA